MCECTHTRVCVCMLAFYSCSEGENGKNSIPVSKKGRPVLRSKLSTKGKRISKEEEANQANQVVRKVLHSTSTRMHVLGVRS